MFCRWTYIYRGFVAYYYDVEDDRQRACARCCQDMVTWFRVRSPTKQTRLVSYHLMIDIRYFERSPDAQHSKCYSVTVPV